MLQRQVLEDAVGRLADVDDLGVGHEDVADEQLVFWRQPEAWIERSLTSGSFAATSAR